MRVTPEMKWIQIKPAMIKIYCNYKKREPKEDTNNQSDLYSIGYDRQESSLSGYHLFLPTSNLFCRNLT